MQALAFGQIVLRVQLGGTTDIKTDLLGWGSSSASLTTRRAYLHLQIEIQPSSMDWPKQESFSLAVPQQHRLQFRLALAALGTPGRSVQPTSIGCFADLVTVALGTWAQLNQGRADLELWSRTVRPKGTESLQLALGSTDSASRKKSSLYSTSLAMAPSSLDRQHNRATLLAPLQPRIPLMWKELLSCKLSLALWHGGMQTSSIPSDPFLHLMWRQGAYQNSFMGSPGSLGQLRSWVVLGICTLHKHVTFS